MPHLLALGLEINPARFMLFRDARDAFGHFDARILQRLDLIRVIRHQPHARNAEMPQDRAGQGIVAQVALEAELFVGLDGIGAAVL